MAKAVGLPQNSYCLFAKVRASLPDSTGSPLEDPLLLHYIRELAANRQSQGRKGISRDVTHGPAATRRRPIASPESAHAAVQRTSQRARVTGR